MVSPGSEREEVAIAEEAGLFAPVVLARDVFALFALARSESSLTSELQHLFRSDRQQLFSNNTLTPDSTNPTMP